MRPACEPTAALGGFVRAERLFASACTSLRLALRSRCALSPRPTFCPLSDGKNYIILQTLKHNFGPRHYLAAKVKVASSEEHNGGQLTFKRTAGMRNVPEVEGKEENGAERWWRGS